MSGKTPAASGTGGGSRRGAASVRSRTPVSPAARGGCANRASHCEVCNAKPPAAWAEYILQGTTNVEHGPLCKRCDDHRL